MLRACVQRQDRERARARPWVSKRARKADEPPARATGIGDRDRPWVRGFGTALGRKPGEMGNREWPREPDTVLLAMFDKNPGALTRERA